MVKIDVAEIGVKKSGADSIFFKKQDQDTRQKGKTETMVEPVEFTSFEDIEERFQADWIAFRSKK